MWLTLSFYYTVLIYVKESLQWFLLNKSVGKGNFYILDSRTFLDITFSVYNF